MPSALQSRLAESKSPVQAALRRDSSDLSPNIDLAKTNISGRLGVESVTDRR
jgi:hypothetical protein